MRYDMANHYAWRMTKLKGALPEALRHWSPQQTSDCLKTFMTHKGHDLKFTNYQKLLVMEDI